MNRPLPATIKANLRPGYILQCLSGGAMATAVVFAVLDYPLSQARLAVLLGLYAVLLTRFPSCWLIVLPVLVPVLDLTPLSGRVFFGEFDLFVLTTIAVSFLRTDRWTTALRLSFHAWLLVILLFIWQAYTTLNGLLPLPEIDANASTSYYSQLNALRIAKGFFGALLLLPALGQAFSRQEAAGRILAVGMLASLAAGVLVILWERALFTGLLNFSTPYRVTGLFSIMATGGAPVDAHLIMTMPFVYMLFRRPGAWLKAASSAFLVAALYAVAVTYSRADYPALLLSALVGGGLWLYQNWRSPQKAAPIDLKNRVTVAAVILLVSAPLFSGDYIQDRFTTVKEDLQGRLIHWSWSIGIMGDTQTTTWFGMGKGSFPRTYLWHRPDGDLPSTAVHRYESHNNYIEMGPSHPSGDIFLRQRFNVTEPGPYRISIDLKPRTNRQTRLLIEVCERIIFQAYRECSWTGINTIEGSLDWENYNSEIDVSGLGTRYLIGSRPVEISILNRGMWDGINIDNVQLITPSGKKLLANSSFDEGMDHWFLYSGDHLSWHIKNIWVDSYFEGGLVGLAMLMLLAAAIVLAIRRRVHEKDELVIPLASALAGLFVVGAFDSLFDSPRIGLLIYLMVWMTLSRSENAGLAFKT